MISEQNVERSVARDDEFCTGAGDIIFKNTIQTAFQIEQENSITSIFKITIMETAILAKADKWIKGNFDPATKEEVVRLQKENEKELADAFYRNLEFGTGGLRGIMGVGTNRMN